MLKTYAQKRTQLDYAKFLFSLDMPGLQAAERLLNINNRTEWTPPAQLPEQVFENPHIFRDTHLEDFFNLYEILNRQAFFKHDAVDRLDYELNYGYDLLENRIFFCVSCDVLGGPGHAQDIFEISYVFMDPIEQTSQPLLERLMYTYMDVIACNDQGTQAPTLEDAEKWVRAHLSASSSRYLDSAARQAGCVFYEAPSKKDEQSVHAHAHVSPIFYESHLSVVALGRESLALHYTEREPSVEVVLTNPRPRHEKPREADVFAPTNQKAAQDDPRLQIMLDFWDRYLVP